jgi:hypothetical protein
MAPPSTLTVLRVIDTGAAWPRQKRVTAQLAHNSNQHGDGEQDKQADNHFHLIAPAVERMHGTNASSTLPPQSVREGFCKVAKGAKS